MSERIETRWISTRGFVLLLTMGLLAAVLMLAPRTVGAQTWSECLDEGWAGYNECLMQGTAWFHRMQCDISFQLEAALCTASKLGEIKEAIAE